MAVQRHAGTVAGDALYAELRGVLASLRGDAGADAMARKLVRRDFRQELVALVDGGRRAAYYDPLARRLSILPFNRDGFDDPEDVDCRADTGDRGAFDDAAAGSIRQAVESPASWVRNRDDLAWVHPRHRWALDAQDP